MVQRLSGAAGDAERWPEYRQSPRPFEVPGCEEVRVIQCDGQR